MQQRAGNRAVAGMLQRFYEDKGPGQAPVWHSGNPDRRRWRKTGRKHYPYWFSWLGEYELYARKPPQAKFVDAPEAPEHEVFVDAPEAPPQIAAPVTQPPAPAAQAQAPGPAPPQIDDPGFTTVRNRDARQQQARAAVDIPTLQAAIDGHRGDARDILVPFNQLFNAAETQGRLQLGRIVETYRSRRDRQRGGFSVAVTIPGLNNWVIHMHCNADGTQAAGENPTHYKHVRDEGEVGVSIALSPRQIRELIPEAAARLQAAANLPPI